MNFKNIKKLDLGLFPTPIHQLKNISSNLGINLYIKRDDLNGLGLGGNKIRKLNYLAADALEKGCNVLLTYGGVQTNHGRLTAAVAARLGLKCCLVLTGAPPQIATGNLILDRMLDTDLVFVDDSSFRGTPGAEEKLRALTEKATRETIERYEKNGDRVYVIPIGGSNVLGAMGYVDAVDEMEGQLAKMGVGLDYMIVAYGSVGTYGGLIIGRNRNGSIYKIIGMNVLHDFEGRPDLMEKHINYFNIICDDFDLGVTVTRDDVWIEKGTIRKGYNIPDSLTQDRVLYLARKEGILLDFCYTGKAFSGLVDLIEQGKIPPRSNVLFLHTGGMPGIFSDIHTNAIQGKIWNGRHLVFSE